MSKDTFAKVFGWVGVAMATYFAASPAVLFYKLIKGKTILKDIPYLILFVNFLSFIIWVVYGLQTKKAQVLIGNSITSGISFIWMTIFLHYYAQKEIFYSLLYNIADILIAGGLFALLYFLCSTYVNGKIALVLNILMYAAPLQKIIRVIKETNYELIPIFTSLGGAISSVSWTIYSFVIFDSNILIPNLVGILFIAVQIVLYFVIKKKVQAKKEKLEGLVTGEGEGEGENDSIKQQTDTGENDSKKQQTDQGESEPQQNVNEQNNNQEDENESKEQEIKIDE